YPPVTEYPNVVLTNGELALTVVLPDAKRGFYRGTRFDWSGQVARAEYRGHTLFAPWKSPHDPENYEDAIGTAEEFGINAPVGRDPARPGEAFMKIGVGLLEKPDGEPYRFSRAYRVVEQGAWKLRTGEDRIEFTQELKHPAGWAYRYTKQLRL